MAVALALVVSPLATPRSASALTISPIVIDDVVLNPGEAYVGTIRLHNETPTAETFFPVAMDFTASDESGSPKFVDDAGERSIKDWITFSRTSLTIEPGDGELVVFTVRAPRDAAPGGYFAGLLFSSSRPSGQGVGAVGATGPLLLVRVSGNVLEKGSVSSFTAEQESQTSLPVTFNLRFQNDGNTHIKPMGFVRVTNMFGGTSAVIPVNAAGGNVLPESARVFSSDWAKAELPENSSELSREWNNFAIGPYTATLILNYGEGKQVASATASFWVMPWMLIVLFVILLVVLALLLMQYNRWVVARATLAQRHK